jgi:serine/threonine protein kinase
MKWCAAIQLRITAIHENGTNCRINKIRIWAHPSLICPSSERPWVPVKYAVDGANIQDPSPARPDTRIQGLTEASVQPVQLVEGLVINGQYRMERKVGEGGFGSTWLARDRLLLDAEVVLKFL